MSAERGTPRRGAPRPMRERLLRFLNRELAAGRDDMDELHSLPIEERVERGYCIDRLRFLSWENNGARLVLECRENTSRFRAGESLTLGYGHDPGSGVGVNYVAYDPAAGRLRVDRDPWRREGWESLDLTRPLALDQVRADHIRIAIEAIENVYGARDERSARIQSILEGTMEPALDRAEEAAAARLLAGPPARSPPSGRRSSAASRSGPCTSSRDRPGAGRPGSSRAWSRPGRAGGSGSS